jgi:hypothetical protein
MQGTPKHVQLKRQDLDEVEPRQALALNNKHRQVAAPFRHASVHASVQ